MDNENMYSKINRIKILAKDCGDVIFYVAWTLSVFVFSYYQTKMDGIDKVYQKTVFIFFVSSIWLYKNETKALTKEIIKSTSILLGSGFIAIILGSKDIDIEDQIRLAISNILYAAIGYVVIFVMKKSINLHGKKAYFLETMMIIMIFLFLFVFKWNPYVSVIVSMFAFYFKGYFIWINMKVEERKQKAEEEKIKEKQERKALRNKEIRKKHKKKHKKGQTGRR